MNGHRRSVVAYVIVGLVVIAGCSGTVAKSPATGQPAGDRLSGDTTTEQDVTTTERLTSRQLPMTFTTRQLTRHLLARMRADGELSSIERRTITQLTAIDPTHRSAIVRAILSRPSITEEIPMQLSLFRAVDAETKARMLQAGLDGRYDRSLPPWLRIYIASRLDRASTPGTVWRIDANSSYTTYTTVNALEEQLWTDGRLSRTDIEGLVIYSRYVLERPTFINRTWSRYDQLRTVIDLRHRVADGTLDARTLARMDDTDGDLLIDHWERTRSDTDPTTPHTDTDAFTDAQEVFVLPTMTPPGEQPNATRPDVYVEIDYEAGLRPRLIGERKLVEEFDTHGVTLHLLFDDQLKELTTITADRKTHLAHTNADYSTKGFFYAVLIEEDTVLRNGQAEIVGLAQGDSFVAKYNIRAFAHELGHVLGLDTTDFPGIDAYRQPGYNSIMKYEYAPIEYSDQGPFNDWREMYATGFNTSTTDLRLRCQRCTANTTAR